MLLTYGRLCKFPWYDKPHLLGVWCQFNHTRITLYQQILRNPGFVLFVSFSSLYLPLSWRHCHWHAKQRNNVQDSFPWCTGVNKHAKYIQWSLRQCSGLNKSTLTALIADKRIYTQETSEYLLWSPLTPPTTSSHQTLPHLDLLPTPPFYTLPPSPPNMSPVGGVLSGLYGGLLTTGPDNQRVCKCQCVIFKSLFMVRVLKEDIFYGNCCWSILLYIYVINMWVHLHLIGSLVCY